MSEANRTSLLGFDELPRSANVRLPVVAALFAISRATVWRWCKRGDLPKPVRINGVTFWNVGELRDRLNSSRLGAIKTNAKSSSSAVMEEEDSSD
jgi:predicted DNA-binding transcriptional regulator AlpA